MADHDPVLREHGYHTLRVKKVVPETADASSLVLDVPDGLRETFRYRPGQFCTFRVMIEGEQQLRSYSMSSAPETDDDLAVTVKRVAGGAVSNWLLDHARDGTVLEVTKPAGVFCPQPGARPVLGFCGGSGVTPVMSIIKHVLSCDGRRPVRLLYANRDRNSVIFDETLADLEVRWPERFSVRHHLDVDGGFLRREDITEFVDGDLDADFYICGPGPFMDMVESTLLQLGVQRDRIFIERFLVDQQEKDRQVAGGAGADSADGALDVTAGAPDTVTITLGGKTVEAAYQPGDTLLETARRGALRPPFSCEAGNCATCMAFLKEGSVTMRANNALTPEEVEDGWVLTCQSVPRGATVTIEYEAM
jgi:3-ketosteroid 9alpha-monooxygenase subunit B